MSKMVETVLPVLRASEDSRVSEGSRVSLEWPGLRVSLEKEDLMALKDLLVETVLPVRRVKRANRAREARPVRPVATEPLGSVEIPASEDRMARRVNGGRQARLVSGASED